MAAIVRPWKEPLKAMMPGRPVYALASLRAPSVASAPPLEKKVLPSSPGAISAIRLAHLRVDS